MMSKVSIVVPVYKNSGTIFATCEKIMQVFDASVNNHSYEIVLVDDGSPDNSYQEMCTAHKTYPDKIVIVKLTRNFGQVPAMLAGYKAASGDAVISVSADLQDPIELMKDMVEKWEGGNEIVVAFRKQREDSAFARILSRLAYKIARSSNPNVPEGGFDYVLMSRKAVSLLLSYRGRHKFFQGDVLWAGLPTAFIPYIRKARPIGKSGYNFWQKYKMLIDWTLDASYLPIRFMSGLGILTAFIGIGYGFIIILAWFFRKTPFEGWAPIMIVTLVIGGMLMMMMGLIGEYLWRIYDDIRDKPLYVVDSVKKNVIDSVKIDNGGNE